ncbi:hypothetical protein FRC18_011210 [Serendipita sp. 400]|nr:hypothetical protein FRC18_011210 [Serendipita sp. 400]
MIGREDAPRLPGGELLFGSRPGDELRDVEPATVTGPGLARGDETIGLNEFRGRGRGLPDGLPFGLGEEGRVLVGDAGFNLDRLEGESYIVGANDTLETLLTFLSAVLIVTAGVKVGDLNRMSTISTEGRGDVSSGKGESCDSVASFLHRF